ncbi:YesL family protein [Gracilibacillus dipsosauri]|uniref:YesL family protein n=1 Tax=Gracilibacillus dipsosauri TaxID=178340 RepID=UPI0024091B6F
MLEKRWYNRLGDFGFNLILLNILWVAFTLLGLVIFGLFPATIALFAVIRKWILENEDTPILQEFIKRYKAEFKMANVIGYIVFLIGMGLYLDFQIVQKISNESLQVLLINAILVIGIFYLIAVLYVFPLYVHFDFKLMKYLQYACILSIARPFQTIMMVAFVGVILYLYMLMPALIFPFGMSLFSYIVMRVAALSFPKKKVLQET